MAVQKLDPTPPGQQPSRRRPSLSYRLWSEGGWIQDKLSTYLSEMFFSLSLSLLCHFGICLSISACLCHLKQEVSKKIRDGWHRQELGAEPNKRTDGAPGKINGTNLLLTTSKACHFDFQLRNYNFLPCQEGSSCFFRLLSPDRLHNLFEVDVDAHDEEGETHAEAEEHIHQDVLVCLIVDDKNIT